MNQSNRPPRSALTPEQERRRAEWTQYAAEEEARRRAAAEARRRAEAERTRREEKARRARRAEAGRLFVNRFLAYLIMLALILLAIGAIFVISLHRTDEAPEVPKSLSYAIGQTDEGTGETARPPLSFSFAYADAVRGGVTYLPMAALVELLDLTVTGTADVQKFSTAAGEYVRFTANSVTAEVNGEPQLLDGAAFLAPVNGSETLWIPLSFVADWVQGVTVEQNAETAEITVKSVPDVPVAFLIKGGAPLNGIDEKEEFGNTPAIAFTADLSAYEQYMNPTDRDAYLTLINVGHKLASDYIPPDLINIADTRRDGRNIQQMREYAAKALEAFFIEMRACGISDVSVTSAYRAYSYQVQLFEQRVDMYPSLSRAEAEARAATVVAIPGSSEHQSGLCIDMHNLPSADISFAKTASFKWVSENAHKFGFILRFPADKTEITGISYEPWHYRYVGRYHATRIYESGLCLEEYVEKYGYLGSMS